jgi:AcrR family transcriptional regulator
VTDGPPARAGRGRRPSRGRRPGSTDTRLLILLAARAAFAERGFDGATVRDVAVRASVDPALVLHYFGSKQALFVAAMEFPLDVRAMVRRLTSGPADEIGERFVRFVLEVWDAPETRPVMLGIVRSATTDPVAAAMLRQVITEGPVLALAAALDRPDAALRATLAGSQVIGLIMVRYVVGVEPLASASEDVLIRTIGATIQRYLTGDLESDEGDPWSPVPGAEDVHG